MSAAGALLEVEGLTRRFGGVTAVDALTLRIDAGEVVGVIGPNGAGKSTLIGLISGAVPASAGVIRLGGADVTRTAAPARARLGIARTYQIPRPFAGLTVRENLLLAACHAGNRDTLAASRRHCTQILDRTGLQADADVPAGRLTLLRRKRLELARALALRPRVLLLDEIGAGLQEHETAELIGLLRQLRGDAAATVVVEHVMDVIAACCDRTAVLNFGRLVTCGPTAEVLDDPAVASLYLGTATARAVARPAPAPASGRAPSQRAAVQRRDRPALLDVDEVHVAYGGVRALRGVSLHVGPGEVVALLGANGAGKSTLARAVSGVASLGSGAIVFDGHRIDRLPPHEITARGVAHCLEGRRVFGTLTVEENLMLGAGRARRAEIAGRLDDTYDVFPVLAQRRRAAGTALSGGQQQMLAIGRALMSRPRLIIFDEISLGLAPVAIERLYAALASVRATGVAMLLIEENIDRALDLAGRAYVLADGRVALDGVSREVRHHPTLRSLYIGEAGVHVVPSIEERKLL
jgi:branched-chain amino acid transport system ATP-binding protein